MCTVRTIGAAGTAAGPQLADHIVGLARVDVWGLQAANGVVMWVGHRP
jgi:hypothetical protein